MNLTSIILVFAGLYAVIGAIGNWDWFMENRKAIRWVKLIGRDKARVFYILLGTVLIVIGTLFSVGIIG